MLLAVLIGWLDGRQQETVAYVIEENRILRRQLRVGVSGSAMKNGAGWPFGVPTGPARPTPGRDDCDA
jgi:hypothetical protein